MERKELEAIFDQQAATYDQQWNKLAPVKDAMHLLIGAVFSSLPKDARVLCIGAGTGAEILYLSQRFTGHNFTVVEPSIAMLDVCRRQAEEHGIASRCEFHHGYLDSLAPSAPFDAATSLLVSQFILEPEERSAFFRAIAKRLRPGGYLASADLASDIESPAYHCLLDTWVRMLSAGEVPADMVERFRTMYGRDVAVTPPEGVSALIESGGFSTPVPFYQAGLVHAWYATRLKDV
ncbi:class I SAM-dependent methyltransferase [Vreelandella nigrificans]|uniref:SAM-dependent methyltransferase n=1 Tax=Vreelandella nigrificans TaxID=2042704 RepID=A0A2A4HLV3_9GAMM|nr:class I SAM-dependent methyltransferase [Halomonas nigrificans]PCF95359.1 SAM-dependent methyltransferase [Halomonas nigrificans]